MMRKKNGEKKKKTYVAREYETFSNRPAHRTKKNIHRVYRFLVVDDDERGVFQTV
jgi:IS4 transposase